MTFTPSMFTYFLVTVHMVILSAKQEDVVSEFSHSGYLIALGL